MSGNDADVTVSYQALANDSLPSNGDLQSPLFRHERE
jgi:hypothetical protein